MFSPFCYPLKTPIGGLYYQYSLFYLFDLSKKGYFSLPFLAIIALLFFLRNLSFFVFRTVPLSLYTVSGNGTIPTVPVNAASAALRLFFIFFLHSLLHLTPSRLTANLITRFLCCHANRLILLAAILEYALFYFKYAYFQLDLLPKLKTTVIIGKKAPEVTTLELLLVYP